MNIKPTSVLVQKTVDLEGRLLGPGRRIAHPLAAGVPKGALCLNSMRVEVPAGNNPTVTRQGGAPLSYQLAGEVWRRVACARTTFLFLPISARFPYLPLYPCLFIYLLPSPPGASGGETPPIHPVN